MAKILATARSFATCEAARKLLEEAGHTITWNPTGQPLSEAELLELIPGQDALITGTDEVSKQVIEAGEKTLKVIAKYGVGYDNIAVAAAKERGITVTFTPGVLTQSVAELTMGLMLAAARNIAAMDQLVRGGKWQRMIGIELAGKTLGIVGTGNIGSEVAKRAAAFDMNIVAYDVYPKPELIDAYGVTYLPLDELLSQADFVSLHTPSLPQTVGLINQNTLQRMKQTAILINTARGDLIVEADLLNALEQGVIAGAGLDTFAVEPLAEPRFFALNNVVLTPHAGSNTKDTVYRMSMLAAADVTAVLAGRKPQYPVK